MFSFGLFSSGIPYILLIAMHVVYFAAFTLNKLWGEEENPIANTENNQTFKEKKDAEETSIYYTEISSYDEDTFTVSLEKHPIIKIDNGKYILSNDSPKRQFFFNSILSRPPPYSC